MSNPNWDDVLTTTLYNRQKKLADNVTGNNALLDRLNRRGKVRPADGGAAILHELEYQENAAFVRYSGYEQLNVQPTQPFTAAQFEWKQAAVAVAISGLEMLKNSGESQQIELLASRVGNAERTMANNISADIYSSGTADGGKQIGGLQLIVADDPTTGTVGGINRATYTYWRNALVDFSVDLGSVASATTILKAMNLLYLRCSRGNDMPDLIVMDNVYFGYYLNALQANQRYVSDLGGEAGAGFRSLKFWGGAADVIFDGGIGGDAPASHGYFLNTSYIQFRPHKDRNMVPLNPDRFAVNQDAMVKLIAFAGNLTCGNSSLQGVLHA